MVRLLTHAAYFAIVFLMTSLVPKGSLGEIHATTNTILVLGFLGTWRYTWAAINFTRAIIYVRYTYPRRKARAFARFEARGAPCHAYFLVTTYMVERDTTIDCYRALFLAAAQARDGATIIASVVEGSDERLIRSIFDTCHHDLSRVKLVLDRIKSNGKRDAMARTLKLIAAESPTARDIVVFVDGDTMVPADIVAQSAPMFTNARVGALTTDEGIVLHKKNLFRDWFILRFNQRQVMMSSMGISNRVLTLTGRMSVFRADLATNPDFVNGVLYDYLEHWRLGHVKFLTGDDKSTWYWLLKNGYEMTYLPDVQSVSMETQPAKTFFESSKVLMTRWFGNMMRTNARAIALGPRRLGFFTWWSILDQRISMWTTMVGPISVVLAAAFHSITIIPFYIAWVMLTRYTFCVIISLFRGTWFPITHPFILYFGQIAGAAVKIYILFRLDKQKWTRQGATTSGPKLSLSQRMAAFESTVHHVLALAWLMIAVVLVSKI